ncbi:acyl-CoA carboxylase epsilon subunit [Streptomyces buecherae]|uniref:acyl-CoA carboxylase epsilon subunit n=1 Tax=Streptomyces buecherae TaxID=2763006 RepID=UPI001C9A6980
MVIKVVRGNPTPEELAAALAVVRARAAARGAAASDGEAPQEWSDPARTVPGRRLPHPGPKAWRTAFWPA